MANAVFLQEVPPASCEELPAPPSPLGLPPCLPSPDYLPASSSPTYSVSTLLSQSSLTLCFQFPGPFGALTEEAMQISEVISREALFIILQYVQ